MRRATTQLALAAALCPAAFAQTLQIEARDDRPAPVNARVEARDTGGGVLSSQVVAWAADDNGWSTLPVAPIVLPAATTTVRVTFINDTFSGPGDGDRNLFIDYLLIDGNVREGESFDRTGGTDPQFPGCGSSAVVDGRPCTDCGNQNDWVEYDILPSIGTSFCDAADGSLAFCPCSNPGKPEAGCDNAQATGGVQAVAVAQDTGAGTAEIKGLCFPPMGTPTAIVIRANNEEPTPIVFGDGLRCVGLAGFSRLAATAAVAGTSCHSFAHGAGPGDYYYQIWYRNTPASYCDPTAPFNLSNGVQLTW